MPESNDPVEIALDQETTSYDRRRAVREMAALPADVVVGPLGTLLADEDRYLRREVVASLARLASAGSVPVLIEALKDADDYVQRDAARALGEIGDSRAVQPLEALLDDDFYAVRDAAKTALTNIERQLPEQTETPTAADPQSADDDDTDVTVEQMPGDVLPVEPAAPVVPRPVPDVAARPAEVATTATPDGFSWGQARRMQLFFGDEATGVQAAYEQLHGGQGRLFELEHGLRDISTKLSLQRADKEDDLTELDETISSSETGLRKLERELARTAGDKISRQNRLKSFWYGLLCMLLPSKKRDLTREISLLGNRIRELGDQIAERREELNNAQQQHDELSDPIRTLKDRVDELTTEKDALTTSIRAANGEIDDRVLRIIRALPPQELEHRVGGLRTLASNVEFFGTCAANLLRSLVELADAEEKVETTRRDLEEASRSSHESLAGLGATITSGFELSSVDRRTSVRLEGSVYFKEDSSFFGGYSGASGSASGSGSGEGIYTVDEVAWQPPVELGDRVGVFAEASASLGEKTAELEALTARQTACRRSIADYANLVRTELERDFEGV